MAVLSIGILVSGENMIARLDIKILDQRFARLY